MGNKRFQKIIRNFLIKKIAAASASFDGVKKVHRLWLTKPVIPWEAVRGQAAGLGAVTKPRAQICFRARA